MAQRRRALLKSAHPPPMIMAPIIKTIITTMTRVMRSGLPVVTRTHAQIGIPERFVAVAQRPSAWLACLDPLHDPELGAQHLQELEALSAEVVERFSE